MKIGSFLKLRHVALAMILLSGVRAYGQDEQSVMPSDGFVPTAETATRIAEAVLIPIYGDGTIASERPFVATLQGDIWYVVGTLPQGLNTRGGVAEVRIQKRDGRIIFPNHGR